MSDPAFTDLNHISVATRDLDRAVRIWADRYGIGPWRVYTYDSTNMVASVDGEPTDFAMRVALCQLGPHTRVEIIQPLDERSPYAHSLQQRGGADHLHHIRMDVEDYQSSVERLERLDLGKVLAGTFQSGVDPDDPSKAIYFGTEADLGFVVELALLPPGLVLRAPDYIYPDGD